MAKQEITFNCLGFKKEKGFRPASELEPEDFYPLDNLPPEISGRIANAFIDVLSRSSRQVNELKKAE